MSPAEPLLCFQALHAPKHGNTEEEYEDAWSADPAAGRFAVADGATESSFAALWAKLLVEGFVAAAHSPNFAGWLSAQRGQWAAAVSGLDLPWFAEMKRDQGAFATFLGLSLRPPNAERPGLWQAEAVGDSCLVRIRKGQHLLAFPLTTAAAFSNRPNLIGSRDRETPKSQHTSGSLLFGDRILLMTDAFAEWFLRTRERGGRPWELVADVLGADRPQVAFAECLEGLRKGGALRNDDVTLVVIDITATSPDSGPSPKE
jgi:hypothetical protein